MDKNVGIARALNFGMEMLQRKGYIWGLTMDQDSICPSGMIQTFLEFTENPKAGILCPRIQYEDMPRKEKNVDSKTTVVKACMTSGSLTRIRCWKQVGGYDEKFFVDYIDNDFCERIKMVGYQCIRVNSVVMSHELGESRSRLLGGRRWKYIHHASWRYYYMIRNNLIFIRRYRRRLNTVKEYCKVVYIVLYAMIYESDKRGIARAIAQGIKDSIIVKKENRERDI